MTNCFRSWIEIDQEALIANYRVFSGTGATVAPVLKANAYGHGLCMVAKLLSSENPAFWCVDSIKEARELASCNVSAPILILGWVNPEECRVITKKEALQFRFSLHQREDIQKFQNSPFPLKFHLKVDTGLSRLGYSFLQTEMNAEKQLEIEGVYTHFANVEDTLNPEFFDLQFSRFCQFFQTYFPDSIHHCCSSAAAMLHEKARFDLIRIGISLYGHYASEKVWLSMRERNLIMPLRPVLTLKTRVAQVRKVDKGDFVGYGCTHRVLGPSRIAILPIGYYDGFPRNASMQGRVLIRGISCPLVGRVAMNMMMVDVTHIPGLQSTEEVVLIGSQENESISAEEIAIAASTINYEVLTRLSPNLPRVLKGN